MTTKNCPSCRTTASLEARFCRQCGAPLRSDGTTEESVSTLASTVQLTDTGARPTDNFSTANNASEFEQEPRRTLDTARVSPAELNDLLQRPSANQSLDHNATLKMDLPSASLPTSSLTPPATGSINLGETMQSYNMSETIGSPSSNPAPFHPSPSSSAATGMTTARPVFIATDTDADIVTVVSPSRPTTAPVASGGAAKTSKRSVWLLGLAAVVPLLLIAAVAVWLVARSRNENTPPANEVTIATPTPTVDAEALASERLNEAESLLSSGDSDGAIARLREAIQLNPSNAEAHRRLGDVLLTTGARPEALEAYRAATRIDPSNAAVWRALASVQLTEEAYSDAADSFARAFALDTTNGVTVEERARLQYADALRLAGRTDEARPVYQELTQSSTPETARAARQHLAELTSATPQPSRTPTASPTPLDERASPEDNRTLTQTPTPTYSTPTPVPTSTLRPAITANDHYERGAQLWSSGNRSAALTEFRAAQSVPDSHYYLGLSYVEGRNLQTLNQAALIAALGHFQTAQRGSRFRAQAARYHQQLTAEFDRRRGTGR